MNTVKFDKMKTLVIAHRGLSGIEKENTNAAFIAAGNRSYYGIECDIHRTADRRFCVCHDGDLRRVSGIDKDVEKSSLAELEDVILLDVDQKRDRRDLRVSTLENYIKICKKYEKHSVLELKSDFSDEEIFKIIEIIRGYSHLKDTTFISFSFENLLKIRKFLPDQSVQFLFSDLREEVLELLAKHRMDADVKYSILSEKTLHQMHLLGIKVNCWTVDDPKIAEKLASWGVDFITSNILE